MGYDVCLTVDVGGEEPARLDSLDENYTYNCGRMLVAAIGVSLSELPERAGDAAVLLREAIAKMDADMEVYRGLNPENGWGDADSWRRFLIKIATACEEAPNAMLHVT